MLFWSIIYDRKTFIVPATVITIINYDRTDITIVNYAHLTFKIQATGLFDPERQDWERKFYNIDTWSKFGPGVGAVKKTCFCWR